MRITQLTPGTGHFYCGNCLRDTALGQAWRTLGHDVTSIPLYLPVHTESDPDSPESRVFLGGINVYLQHRLPWLRHLPGPLRRWLDRPGLLRWSSRQGDMTDAETHADLALAILQGTEIPELTQLLEWMREHDRPDAVCLCNCMLVGFARPIRETLDVPVVTTLHGEDGYLDAFPEPQRSQAWATLRTHITDVDACIAVSRDYGERMTARLGIPPSKLHVVHNGIALDDIEPADAVDQRPGPLTIGYLARMCSDKGLDTLVDAFINLRQRPEHAETRLTIMGVQLKADRRFVKQLSARLDAAGCLDAVRIQANVSRDEKLAMLREVHVLSVPATYGEAFGLYVLEANAHGVPVIQPRHGAFPEVIERSGGGILCDPDDPDALADGLATLLADRGLAARLGESGRHAVHDYFNAERMAKETADIMDDLRRSSIPAVISAETGSSHDL